MNIKEVEGADGEVLRKESGQDGEKGNISRKKHKENTEGLIW